jgi:hypothetical protein
MSVAETESPSPSSERSGSLTVGELAMAMACAGLLAGWTISTYLRLSAHEQVKHVIEEKVLSGKLEPCSALIGTQRHEGKCGSFGKYTVLSGGNDLFVLEGQSLDNPPVAGAVGWFGFRASEELQNFALGK